MSRLQVTKLGNLNSILLRQVDGKGFFISTDDSILIPIPNLTYIIMFLIQNNFISYKTLEGILEEYHSSGKDIEWENISEK